MLDEQYKFEITKSKRHYEAVMIKFLKHTQLSNENTTIIISYH